MRLTKRGQGLLVAGIGLVGAGFWFGYPELAMLGAAALAGFAAALAFVAWRPRLAVTRRAEPDRVTRGEPCEMTLSVSNASRFFGTSVIARDRRRDPGTRGGAGAVAGQHPARRGIGIGIGRGRGRGRHRDGVPVPLVRLRPGGVTTARYPVPTVRRGVVDIGPLEITRSDPLGLVGVVRGYGEPARIWVRPRVHPIAIVPVGLSRSMDGRVDRVPHGSITFAALREYVVGDDLRRVHWRTSARVGQLMVREHVDTSLPRVVILLDDRAEAHHTGAAGGALAESTFEAACEAAASVLVAAAREGVRVELRLVSAAGVGGAGVGGSGAAEMGVLLDLLAEATLRDQGQRDQGQRDQGQRDQGQRDQGQDDRATLAAALAGLRVRRVGDTLVFLTGPPNQDDLGLVAGLRGAYPSIIAGVLGPLESGLGTTAGMLVVSARDGADFAAAWGKVGAW